MKYRNYVRLSGWYDILKLALLIFKYELFQYKISAKKLWLTAQLHKISSFSIVYLFSYAINHPPITPGQKSMGSTCRNGPENPHDSFQTPMLAAVDFLSSKQAFL